ncbi:MAG TPA: response regulator transcription factor [Cryomorphaceae bacterium]|nr:response regulator transcription factor [Cryomorphaceae bacterium]
MFKNTDLADVIKVAIAEDNRAYFKALQDVLLSFDDVKLVLSATNGKDIYHKIVKAETKPDLVLMDIEMPITDGIAATTKIKRTFPEIRVVMISVFDDRERVFEAILAGASGYLLKGEKPEVIRRAIYDALDDRLPMSPVIAGLTLELVRGKHSRDETLIEENDLTSREKEILKELTEAKSYKQIADDLSISAKTVGNHVQNIYAKLQVSSKAEAVKMAYEKNWV